MFNDEPTPYISGVPPEEVDDQVQYQNMSQSDSLENIEYQQPMNQIISNQTNQNNIEDILQKTSIGDLNETYTNPLITSVTQSNIEQQIESPIIEQVIQQPLITNTNTLDQYNNINDTQNIFNSYSYPIVKNINNTHISTVNGNNVNNTYAKVHPINKTFDSPEIINDNNIYNQIQPNNDITNYEQIITQYPQYGNVDQNIIANTITLPEVTTTVINDYQTQNPLSDTVYYTNNDNGLSQSHAQVIPIDEERMKNPKVAKLVKESQRHINNYITKSQNNNYDQDDSYNENQDLSKSRSKKSKNIINNSNQKSRIYMSQKDLNDIKNFSPEFWKNFYPNEDVTFFEPLEDVNNIIKDQMIQNRNKNETYFGEINRQGKKHGFGKLVTPRMERIGNWKDDEFNGWGREIRKNGEIYEGKFVDGKLNGKGIYKDGSIFYVGNFVNYIKDGKGELFTNNYHYVGNFRNNKMDGEGRIELYNKGVYEGQFDKDEMNGYGIFKFNNGDFYEGEIKNGEMNGYGKLNQNNGKILEGYFNDGEFKGEQKVNDMYMYKGDY